MTIFLAILRTVVGLIFVVAGAAKLFQHATFAAKFAGWGVPVPDVSVLVVGALEIVCGGFFALGALTRPVGMLLATIMVAAAYFAGRVEPIPHLIVTGVLFVLTVFFAWRSGRVPGRTPVRRPGVQ